MTIFDVAWSSDALLCIFQVQKLAGLDFGVLSDRNLASQAQIGSKWTQKSKLSIYRWFEVSDWSTVVTYRYFLHPDSIIISRNTIPACNKPCNNFLLQKIITSASKIITLGFVLDLGAQEEFDDNFWCCVKLRCSTLYFSTSETCRFGLWGSVTPKSSLVSPNRTKMNPEGQTKHLQMV